MGAFRLGMRIENENGNGGYENGIGMEEGYDLTTSRSGRGLECGIGIRWDGSKVLYLIFG